MSTKVFSLRPEQDFKRDVHILCIIIILILCPFIMTGIGWLNIILLTAVSFGTAVNFTGVNEVTIVKSRYVDW